MKLGIVVIGRNEGDRLVKCLQSAISSGATIVYVDSGSTDDSMASAKRLGVDVVNLDTRIAFTAARARNAGFERLSQLAPDIDCVQFVDGDCEIVRGWIESGTEFLAQHQDVAVVCGRRRERYPNSTVYNWLCDLEWNTPIGEAKACGGDAVMRANAFRQVGGYCADLIAGEEPELCLRLRQAGWRIWRLDRDMTLHDAAMTRFGQWWRRAMRNGYAIEQGTQLHGSLPERYNIWESRRTWFWGLGLPAVCLIAGLVFWPWGNVLWLIYPAQWLRQVSRSSGSLYERAMLALFQLLARFPETIGQLRFWRDHLLRHDPQLIEYK